MARNKKYQDTDQDRSRVWAFEIYPDSVDENWQQQLAELMIHAYISPLHDKDLDPDGSPKKPHYHIMLMYETVQYPHQVIYDAAAIAGKGLGGCADLKQHDIANIVDVKCITKDGLNWIGIDSDDKSYGCIVKIRSKTGMARYLVHMDNADKYRYQEADVKVLGVPDYLDVCGSSFERYEVIKEMMEYCKDHYIYLYSDLCDYAAENRPCDWYKVLCDSGTYVMDRYIKSLKYKADKQKQELIDKGILR